METFVGGGGGGFCTLNVLPPHPASAEIIAAGRRKRTHRFIATANLLKDATKTATGVIVMIMFIVIAQCRADGRFAARRSVPACN
jgi:hypothetical protein